MPKSTLEISLRSFTQDSLPSLQAIQSYLIWCSQEIPKELKKYKLQNLWPQSKPLFLSLVFVGERRMKNLNYRYRGKNYPTDVLSFPSFPPLGEMVFCVPKIKKQAQEQNHSFYKEWAYLTLHSFLHLLGLDHEEENRYADEMFQIQDHLFQKYLASKKRSKIEPSQTKGV